MFHKMLSTAGMLALAGAAVLWTAGPSQAAPHGGFRGGHFGGAHFGGARIGAQFGGAHFRGFRGGFNHRGFGHAFGFRPFYGYRYPYYGYGAYPYYGYYPYYGTYNSYPYNADYNYFSDLSPSVSTYVPPDYGTEAAADTTAHITVRVPANTDVWVNGVKMNSTGLVREYQSPPLTPGKGYHYEVRVRWEANGQTVTQTKSVPIAAGAHVTVSFPDYSPSTQQKVTSE
jgi:uncharacterized protein (TIGR03000 family)